MGLVVKNLQIFQGGKTILQPMSFRVDAGQALSIMGPSGVGKSTILAAISGSLASEFRMTGDIFLNDQPLNALPIENRNIGFLTQDPLLFPHLSVLQNLLFGAPKSEPNRKEQALKILDKFDMQGMEHRDPATLSGGEAARIALGRALLAKPDAILLDEPFSKLDKALRAGIRDLTFEEIRLRNMPAVLVTHDEEDAKAARGEILRLSNPNIPS